MLIIDDSQVGRSADRECVRRRVAKRARLRTTYGPVGSLVAALAGEPRNVYAWRQGAEGEAASADALEQRLHRSDVVLMHGRCVHGRGRANIDHIAIGPTGVTVIDTKCAARRSVVSPVQPGGTRREVLGSNGLPGSER